MDIDSQFKQANADLRAGRYAEAEKRYRMLARTKPQWAYHNLGALYMQVGRDKDSEVALKTALRLDPKSAASRHMLGMQLLRQGRYKEGWPLYEARRALPDLNIRTPAVAYPEWRGEDLAGKRLVVLYEQGLGDQIQFARFLPRLRELGAQVTYVCRPELMSLFEGFPAEIRSADAPPPAEADYWVMLCSLGLRLGVTLETLSSAPYLPTRPHSTAGGVGVVVKGSSTHKNDRHRSLPEDLAQQVLALGRDLAPAATGAADFLDTARIVADLDLVISVDTSTAHLAAAMGKPTWILIPAVDTDWRWMRSRTDSPWYPSATLYRQPGPGKWAAVVEKIVADLRGIGLQR
jgi:hypothetical protein